LSWKAWGAGLLILGLAPGVLGPAPLGPRPLWLATPLGPPMAPGGLAPLGPGVRGPWKGAGDLSRRGWGPGALGLKVVGPGALGPRVWGPGTLGL